MAPGALWEGGVRAQRYCLIRVWSCGCRWPFLLSLSTSWCRMLQAATLCPVSCSLLTDTISFCQLLRRDASAQGSRPEAAEDHQPPRHSTEQSMDALPLADSFPLVKGHLLHKDSTLSPTLLNSLTCKESQTLTCDSTPPVTTMPKMHPLPRPCGPTSPSCPQDPVFCSPSKTDQSMTPPPPFAPLPRSEWKSQLVTSQSICLPPLTSPIARLPRP